MNAKKELIDLYSDLGLTIKCATIEYVTELFIKDIVLKVGGDLTEFLNELDCEYSNRYGEQYLYGTVWFTDGTWANREVYDGSEWWGYKKCPEIPEELK